MVTSERTASMRSYWQERARLNAAFYVDTSLDYEAPDMERFLATGREIVRIALDDAPVKPAARGTAVEIGCGLGRICLAMSEQFERVIGYDIAPEMLRQGEDLVKDQAVELRLTDGASLPGLDDGSADFILTFTVFQHIPDVGVIRAYIAEAGRALKPGGVFAFQWNNTPGARRWRLHRARMSVVQRFGGGDRYGRDQPEFLGSRVDLEEIDDALRSAGLQRAGLQEPGQLFTWAWATRATED